jgi:hypothetical protein
MTESKMRFKLKIPKLVAVILAVIFSLPLVSAVIGYVIATKMIPNPDMRPSFDPWPLIFLVGFYLILLLILNMGLNIAVSSDGIVLNRIFASRWKNILGAQTKTVLNIPHLVLFTDHRFIKKIWIPLTMTDVNGFKQTALSLSPVEHPIRSTLTKL